MKTRSNTAAAILSNSKDLEDAYKSAMEAEGSALAENEKYLDSIQGRIDLFNNAIQTMWNTELDSGVVKFFVDLGTSLVKVVDNLGLINTLVFGIMTYFAVFKKNKLDFASMLGIHDIEKGWTFGKEGASGWIKNKVTSGKDWVVDRFFPDKKKTIKQVEKHIDDIDVAAQSKVEQMGMFSEEGQTQTLLNEKKQLLTTAKAELKSLNRIKWDDIKIPDDALEYKTGNRKRQYVKEILIPKKEAEIVAIEKDISDITKAAKNKLNQAEYEVKTNTYNQQYWDFGEPYQQVNKKNTKFLDIFQNGLGKGATEKLNVDFDKLSGMLKDLDDLDGEGLRKYMLNLGDLGDEADDTTIALAGYASTVEDGTYSVQGAQRYVREYNKSLAAMSKQAMKAQITQQLLNLAISAIAMLGSAIITGIINKIASAQDEFEELSSELSSIASELQGLESELDGINEQIKELQNQGTLSFSEQEELDRLREESAELERQIDLQKTLQKQKQQQMNQDAPNAAENYYKKTGMKSGKTTGELAGQGANIGLMVGAAIAGALISVLTGGLGTGLGIAAAGGIVAGGTALGAGIGAGIGVSEEKVGENIDNMQEKYTQLQHKYADAQAKYEESLSDKDYEKAQKAQQQLTEFEGNMAKHLTELNTYYSQMDWETATLEQQKAMQEFYDIQDKWAIASGGQGAKVNAIDRIFGTKADKKLQKVGKELKRMAEDGEEINLEKAFDTSGLNEADLEKFSARLREMGIYVHEVEDAFKQAAEAAEELGNTDLYEASKDVGVLTDGLGSLKSAFDEVNEKGYITAKTLDEIKEILGNTDQLGDVWTNYQNIMSSATASTEEMKWATEELVKAFIKNKITFADGPISEDEMAVYVRQLKDMGVKNSEEFVHDLIAEGMYANIQFSAEFDEDEIRNKFYNLQNNKEFQEAIGITANVNWDELDKEIKKKIAEYTDDGEYQIPLSKIINPEEAQKIADEYGFNLQTTLSLSPDTPEDIQSELNKLGEGGVVDLTLRPKIDAKTMQAAGYDVPDGNYSTVDTETAVSTNKTIAMNFTPILPDGRVMEKEHFSQYIHDVVNGVREDDYNLKIGVTYTGEDAGERASSDAQRIHEIHEQYLTEEDGLQRVIDLYEQLNVAETKRENILAKEGQSNNYGQQIEDLQKIQDAYDKMLEYDEDVHWDNVIQSGRTAEEQWEAISYRLDPESKEQFITDFNKLKGVYGNLDVELGIDNASLNDVQEKIDEIESLKTELEVEISPEEKKKVDAEIEDLQKEISELTADINIDFNVVGLGSTGAMFDQYISEMETLASIQAAVANGFTISAAKAREFAAVYPEILASATAASNGQITLNSGVVNAFLGGKKAELDAEIQTEIDKLKAHRESLIAYRDFIKTQIEGVKAGTIAEADAVYAVEKYKVDLYNDSLEQFTDNGEASTDSSNTTTGNMITDNQQYNTQVGKTAEDTATNMYNAASNMSENTAKAYTSMIKNADAYGKAAANAAKAATTGKYTPTKSTSNTFSGAAPDKSDVNNIVFTPSDDKPTNIPQKKEDPKKFDESALEKLNKYLKEVDETIEGVDGHIGLLESLTGSNVSDWNPDKDSSGGGGDEETAFEKLQKRFERWFNTLEHESAVLEKNIELLEAKGLGVPTDYYNKLIENQQHVFDSYADKIKALKEVTPTSDDEWYEIRDAIREAEQAMQDATLAAIEYSKAIVAQYDDVFARIGEGYDNLISLKEDQLTSLENYEKILELNNEAPTKGLYNEMGARIQEQQDGYWKQFYDQQAVVEGLKAEANPFEQGTEEYEAFELTRNESIIKAREEMRQLKLSIQETEIALLELEEKWKDAVVAAWDKVREAYDNKHQYYENQAKLADSYVSRLDALGISTPDSVIKGQLDIQKAANNSLREDYLSARKELIALEKEVGTDDPRYLEKFFEVSDMYQELYDGRTKELELQQKIIDNRFERFNEVIDRINNSVDKLQNISDLLDDKDVATEDGEWTDEGLARLGMAYQQMEYGKEIADEYADEIENLEKLYKSGQISEDKYTERLQELEDGQWDAINAYESAKDAIVELEEARIDMIEEGLDKEIEAYQELIDLKKEELDAERDLYDFKKNIEKQTKDIAALERRIASMGGSTDASTIAERTKLEAELREAKDSLDGTYRDHAYDSMSSALDDELDAYTTNADNYIESLRESIKNTDLLIEQTYSKVLQNTDIVLDTITTLSSTYGFRIDSNLVNPWKNATSETINFESSVAEHIELVKGTVNNATGPLERSLSAPWENVSNDGEGGGAIYQYSKYAKEVIDGNIEYSKGQEQNLTDTLTKGWEDSKSSINQWSTDATIAIQAVIDKANEAARALGGMAPDGVDSSGKPVIGGGNNKTETPKTSENKTNTTQKPATIKDYNIAGLQRMLKYVFGYDLGSSTDFPDGVDGIYGTKTKAAVKNLQSLLKYTSYKIINKSSIKLNGLYDEHTRTATRDYLTLNAAMGKKASDNGVLTKFLPKAQYAKGTMGTTKDQWAITDEIGDELTFVAGPNGTLQFLRRGSTVIPAQFTEELVKIGEVGLDGLMNMPKFDSGVNMVSNAINKPELNLTFDNLIRIDSCTEETIPQVKKIVSQELDKFTKQLNYSLKRVGGK